MDIGACPDRNMGFPRHWEVAKPAGQRVECRGITVDCEKEIAMNTRLQAAQAVGSGG